MPTVRCLSVKVGRVRFDWSCCIFLSCKMLHLVVDVLLPSMSLVVGPSIHRGRGSRGCFHACMCWSYDSRPWPCVCSRRLCRQFLSTFLHLLNCELNL